MKPTFASVKSEVAHLGLTDEEITGIYALALRAYESGAARAILRNELEYDDLEKEKIGVDFAVEAFKDCKTLDDFEQRLREINIRSIQFIPTIGL